MRVGDVALDALDHQLAGQAAAAAVLDHVAEALDRGRLADDAVVDALATCLHGLNDGNGAVGGVAFFVGGEQQGNAAGVVGVRRDEAFNGGHEGGQRGFHVGRAAAVEVAVALGRDERIGRPALDRAGRHDVGVAGKTQHRAAAAAMGP